MATVKSDIEIARASKMKPIREVLSKFSIPDDYASFSPMGRHIAKLNLNYVNSLKEKKSNLILVTAITPTTAGEGKTTTSVGLNDALKEELPEVVMPRLFLWNKLIYISLEIFMLSHLHTIFCPH